MSAEKIQDNCIEQPPRAMLVGLQLRQTDEEFETAMTELAELAKTCGIEPVSVSTQKASSPVQATYVGSGKVEEIRLAAEMLGADLVIFDQTLSPMQFRNLGKLLGVEVMDRTGLILRIFAEQART
ncbi:MAG: GTPase HflX, partial [Eubacterium sp.]|nr:GTPase HflX [Eubacterium sp.]